MILKMKSYLLFLLLFLVVQCDILPSANPVYPSKKVVLKTESNEFEALMEKDQIDKKQVTAEVLTYLLNDDDSKDPKTAAVIDNHSNCDIILRLVEIQGNRIYNLPIPKQSKNQFVIYKGNYTMKANVCAAKYYSQKQITTPLILKLSAN